jgi:hypothetical protein
MKKYFLMAIDKGNTTAMIYLANYYQNIEENYDLAKKYYLMAIEKGNTEAMRHLGIYYECFENNYVLMMKYLLMAIEKGNMGAMHNLGNYYQSVEINYALMKKYLLMAIDKGCAEAMNKLGIYYQHTEKNYDLAKKYLLMAIDKGCAKAMNNLGWYYRYIENNYDMMEKYYLLAIKKGYDLFYTFYDYWETHLKTCGKNINNVLLAMIEGKIKFSNNCKYIYKKPQKKFIKHRRKIIYNLIISMCQIIDNNKLCIDDFKHYCKKIIRFIQTEHISGYIFRNRIPPYDMKYVNHFIKYIGIMYNSKNNKKKECLLGVLKKETSQWFMEYLDFHYYKYLEIKYIPGGKEYKKIEKHFNLTVKQKNILYKNI